mmetsp:Transcript_10566/g.15770  ORF Transcript_10566/g.15770 Transcript_10566/m.15770 type:complete len:316 (-) Transcript_10566:153-1100(-)
MYHQKRSRSKRRINNSDMQIQRQSSQKSASTEQGIIDQGSSNKSASRKSAGTDRGTINHAGSNKSESTKSAHENESSSRKNSRRRIHNEEDSQKSLKRPRGHESSFRKNSNRRTRREGSHRSAKGAHEHNIPPGKRSSRSLGIKAYTGDSPRISSLDKNNNMERTSSPNRGGIIPSRRHSTGAAPDNKTSNTKSNQQWQRRHSMEMDANKNYSLNRSQNKDGPLMDRGVEDSLSKQRADRMRSFTARSRRFHEKSGIITNKDGTIVVGTIVTDRAIGPGAQVSRMLPPPQTRHYIKRIKTDMGNDEVSGITLDIN